MLKTGLTVYIFVCSLVGHGWELADDNTIINGLVAAFSSNNFDIMCVSDTGLESESQNDDDIEQSTEVGDMIDVVYEDETDYAVNFKIEMVLYVIK